MTQKYKRPPVTEAVIEVRLATKIDFKIVEKLKDKFADTHPLPPIPIVNYDFEMKNDEAVVSKQGVGYRLTSADGLDIVTLAPNSLSTSRLAPYEGWEAIFSGAMQNWGIWKRFVGWQPINRIGIRFVNRIDIPSTTNPIETADYFKFSIDVPKFEKGRMNAFVVQASIDLFQDNFKVTLNSANVPGALVGHHSFVLDIDLFRELELPQNDEGLWGCINSARQMKNTIFEACITDKTREIFSS
jgi:uncharacterized protein (TIGR04255 family)